MQEAFSDLDIAALAIKLNKEAHDVVTKAGVELESLPTYPKERLGGLVSMDVGAAAGLFSKIMTSLSKAPLYGSSVSLTHPKAVLALPRSSLSQWRLNTYFAATIASRTQQLSGWLI